MDAAKEIKEKGLSMGARAVGIASVKDINRLAPSGHRPDDLLRGAKSVVVLGGNEPTAGAWRSGNNRVLGSIGYNRSKLGSAARGLAYYLEDRFGYFAIPAPTGDWIGHSGGVLGYSDAVYYSPRTQTSIVVLATALTLNTHEGEAPAIFGALVQHFYPDSLPPAPTESSEP